MRYYPILLDLHDKACLVVGVGQVGTRKVRTLLSCAPGRLRIVDTREPDACWRELIEQGLVEYQVRSFSPEDLDGCFLVIASTSDEALNWKISRMCAQRGILCNIVDQPEKCSFILPAMHSQGDLTIAVSTSGSSPALAKKIREDLGACFGPEYARFLAIMRRLRPILLELGLPTATNTALFRELTQSQLLDAVQSGDDSRILEVLRRHLPESLHHGLEDVIGESD
ncbi:precorrin-2 dehydrogenase/sirohydrochlorin ferrochelatase family protein [Desulfonatronum thioautotrophicum]|uniref:precorrin-2 dehydrogenase/sirohydrochlorin ferrochelatase family protein n=1 Tax=Desulfonatronum thioautotrophicum TaxID=617001 RepID=UPI0005EB62AF|nr:bifunctional precorrin-2 dehydrogenase/sirohydrochlorin ferrochelatase [Desulfonatronum thioautotrophicum]